MTSQQSDEDQGAIIALLDQQARHHADGDAAAVMAAYSDDVVLFDLPTPMQLESDVAGLQEWIDGWDRPPRLTYRDITVTQAGDLATAWGFVHTDARRDGKDQGFWTRNSWVLRRVNGQWQIVHAHASVPFYMDGSMRAALDLQPGTGAARIK